MSRCAFCLYLVQGVVKNTQWRKDTELSQAEGGACVCGERERSFEMGIVRFVELKEESKLGTIEGGA